MKTPVDTPDPDPRVTREDSLEKLVDIEPEDSRQEPTCLPPNRTASRTGRHEPIRT